MVLAIVASLLPQMASYTLAPAHGARELAARRPQQALFMCDGEGVPDSLDLLRIPQISTPERESFKAYRERQRERKFDDAAKPPTEAELMRAEMERLPLGPGVVLTCMYVTSHPVPYRYGVHVPISCVPCVPAAQGCSLRRATYGRFAV